MEIRSIYIHIKYSWIHYNPDINSLKSFSNVTYNIFQCSVHSHKEQLLMKKWYGMTAQAATYQTSQDKRRTGRGTGKGKHNTEYISKEHKFFSAISRCTEIIV